MRLVVNVGSTILNSFVSSDFSESKVLGVTLLADMRWHDRWYADGAPPSSVCRNFSYKRRLVTFKMSDVDEFDDRSSFVLWYGHEMRKKTSFSCQNTKYHSDPSRKKGIL